MKHLDPESTDLVSVEDLSSLDQGDIVLAQNRETPEEMYVEEVRDTTENMVVIHVGITKHLYPEAYKIWLVQ